MGSALGLPASQLIGVDIYEDDAGGEYTRHVLADPTEVERYCASLATAGEAILEATGGRGLALVVSPVGVTVRVRVRVRVSPTLTPTPTPTPKPNPNPTP